MLRWFFRPKSAQKEDEQQLKQLKQEDQKQRLLLKEALEELAQARSGKERND